ncbi:hypothetical protein C9980_20650 [Vibrio mediterranei]|uniref:fimbria/pilus outer membrane usher protein n=2 Tax=Vibrio mediterranei TaxID=689 RepID=UPI000D17FC94|nr:fimbria/pilus outer membrane usher protein [Vibrio mediterranei]MCG9666145.1 fimbria/pilus outer membrane usher protein [Vibrio mediterranei]PTC02934.1 hypothetical protein C9980_20650 [Vibrio mediterranei]
MLRSLILFILTAPLLSFAGGFDLALLSGISEGASLGSLVNHIPDGNYDFKITVNKRRTYFESIRFYTNEQGESTPCFSEQQLSEFGIKPDINLTQGSCVLSSEIGLDIDFGSFEITMNIPSRFLLSEKQYALAHYDDGVTALMLPYSAGMTTRFDDNYQAYGSASPQFNVGRFRFKSSLSASLMNQKTTMSNGYLYGYTNIPSLRSKFMFGELSQSTAVMGSVDMQGVSLSSNSRLYQSGQMTDTTTIRANAETNAEVRVYQDNELIHTEYVAAGEFTINDMNIRSNSDFVVSIKEEDGREAVFSVPSQLVLSVLKQGTSEHSLFTGLQRTNSHAFLGGELIYGLTDTQSLTTGLFVERDYSNLSVASTMNFDLLGGVRFSAAHSTYLPTGQSGTKINSSLTKSLPFWSLNFQTSLSHFLGNGYRDINSSHIADTVRKGYQFSTSAGSDLPFQLGSVSLFQSLGGSDKAQFQSFGLGYSFGNEYYRYSVSALKAYSKESNQNNFAVDNRLSMNFSMPLNWGKSRVSLSRSHSSGRPASTSLSSGMRFGDSSSVSGSLRLDDKKGIVGHGLSLSSNSEYNNYSLQYSNSQSGSQVRGTVKGGLVVAENTVLPTRRLSDTNILVRVDDVEGLKIRNAGKTNADGFALIPSASAYSQNRVSVESKSIPDGVYLDNTVANTIPSEGALTLVTYHVKKGRDTMLKLRQEVSLGTKLYSNDAPISSYFDSDGRVFIAAFDKNEEHLSVPMLSCDVNIIEDSYIDMSGLDYYEAECLSPSNRS